MIYVLQQYIESRPTGGLELSGKRWNYPEIFLLVHNIGIIRKNFSVHRRIFIWYQNLLCGSFFEPIQWLLVIKNIFLRYKLYYFRQNSSLINNVRCHKYEIRQVSFRHRNKYVWWFSQKRFFTSLKDPLPLVHGLRHEP